MERTNRNKNASVERLSMNLIGFNAVTQANAEAQAGTTWNAQELRLNLTKSKTLSSSVITAKETN